MQRFVTYYAYFLAVLTPRIGETSPGASGVSNGRPKAYLTSLLAALFCATTAFAAGTSTIKLGWNENPESNVTGYELRYGTTSGRYTESIATTGTSVKVSGIEEGTTYYFVVVAKNRSGLVSPRSGEITYRVDARASEPPAGTIADPTATVTINTGDRVEFTGKASDPNGKKPFTYLWNFGAGSGIKNSAAQNPGFRQFDVPGTYTVSLTVTNSAGTADPTPATRTIIVNDRPNYVISRTKWKLKFVDSEEKLDAKGTYAFDGNPATFWHTRWRGKKIPKAPHEIQIDMGTAGNISGFRYLPRQDGITVGNIGKYEFYVSKNGKSWGKPVARGSFDGSSAEKQVMFTAKVGRYVKLRALRSVGGEPDCNVAELQVLSTPRQAIIAATKKTKAAASASASTAPAAAANANANANANGIAGLLAEVFPTASFSPVAEGGTIPGISGNRASVTSVEVIDGRKYRVLTLRKASFPAGKFPVIQVSSDLLDWRSGKNHTTVVADNARILAVRDNTPVTPLHKRYIRVKP